MLPQFKCSENNTEINRVGRKYHSTGGLLTVGRFPWKPAITNDILAAAVERGYPISEDLNGDQFTGFSVAQTTSKNGVRVSSAAAFLRPFRHRRNLRVALNATATKIIVENQKAVGVQFYQVSRHTCISSLRRRRRFTQGVAKSLYKYMSKENFLIDPA